MGLDMYLRAKRYISGYQHMRADERENYQALCDLFGVSEFVSSDTPSAEVNFTVAYWRKANAIHMWFVNRVQDGKDECQYTWVSRDQLIELRDLCLKITDVAKLAPGKVYAGTRWTGGGEREDLFEDGETIVNAEEIAALLPTTGGFFFGGTHYDSWYMQGIRDTVTQIERALKLSDDWEFEYHSSW